MNKLILLMSLMSVALCAKGDPVFTDRNTCSTSAHCPGMKACGNITLTISSDPTYIDSGFVCVNPE